MGAAISQSDVVRANALLEKLRKFEEAHAKFKAGTNLSMPDAAFYAPTSHRPEVNASGGVHQWLLPALGDIGIDKRMASVMILALFAYEAEKLVKETRAELEKLGVELD